MQIAITRDQAVIAECGRIWAQATARRDDEQADDAAERRGAALIQAALDASEQSALITLAGADELPDSTAAFEDDPEESLIAFAAIAPGQGSGIDHASGSVGELRYLGVAPDRWGEGAAQRLLIALPGQLRDLGYGEAVLWVYADNIRAIFLYEAMGWVATGQSRRHPETNRVESQYRLRLG